MTPISEINQRLDHVAVRLAWAVWFLLCLIWGWYTHPPVGWSP